MRSCRAATAAAWAVLLGSFLPWGTAFGGEEDSPQFRGPDRSGVFPATGLLKSWPAGGPPRVFTATGARQGYASVAVAEGRIYTTGMDLARRGFVVAFDERGEMLWERGYGGVYPGGGFPGTRTTPTWDDGSLYILSSLGQAFALDAASGEIRWQVDLFKTFGGKNISWGITESPLVVGDRVLFTPGGPGATMVALDRATGRTVWTTRELADLSAYCSPRLFDDGRGTRQVITLTHLHLVGVDPGSGELLWKHPYAADIHAVSPVFWGRSIYVSDGYKQGGKMFDLADDGRGVRLRWEEKSLDVHHGGVVVVDGRIYGAASNGAWHVLDAATGRVLATARRRGKGSVISADGMLYGYVETGPVLLVNPDPEDFRVVSSFEVRSGEGPHWAHPVIANRTLYIRHGDVLTAYDLRDPAARAVDRGSAVEK